MKIFKHTGKDGSGPVAATKLTEALRLRERSAQTESAFGVQREPEAPAGPRAAD